MNQTNPVQTFNDFTEWSRACVAKGFDGPYDVQPNSPAHVIQFVSCDGGGTAAIWNPRSMRGTIFS
jgi:hypothetical protein